MNELPAIYLFLFMNPELLMENFLSPPIGTMKDRTIDEVFPIMVQDQNIKTIFNFEVNVRVIINYSSTKSLGQIIFKGGLKLKNIFFLLECEPNLVKKNF